MAAVMGRFLDRPFELVLELEVLSWLGGLFENRRFWALVTEPVPPRIERPVVILTSWHTGSAAERLARVLQQVAGAIVIGEQTIGAEAGLVTVAGGDGTTLKFGAQRALETNGVGFQDEGITPDIAVRLTLDDLRRCGSYRAAFGDWERRVERAAELRLGRMVAEVPAASDG